MPPALTKDRPWDPGREGARVTHPIGHSATERFWLWMLAAFGFVSGSG